MSNNPPDQPTPGPEQPSEPADSFASASQQASGSQPGGEQSGSAQAGARQPDPDFATPPRPAGDPSQPYPGPPRSGPSTVPPPPVTRQLVRDPFAKLGGVASGLSHHYGIDVSLIRLAFVFFTFVTGFGIVFYALSWIIIPRAQFWPPVGDRRPSKQLSTREIGIGLLLLGALIALFVNGGTFSQILAPMLLIGGGVWLLAQSPAPDVVPPPPVAASPPVDPVAPVRPAAGQVPQGTPVPARSGRRKVAVVGFIGVLFLIPMLFVGALAAAVFLGEVDFEADPGLQYNFTPATVDAIPERIQQDEGSIRLDLTELDLTGLDDATSGEPAEIDIDLGFGDIEVIIPDGLDVDVDADAGLGSVEVFDRNNDGIRPNVVNTGADADVIIDVHVDVGDIRVERSNS